ncbi:NAD-P-binding protein [Favolaschia claudopus]|uniref:NAD-P-binding protein n=1 Tax=Favolaschia claudopus TaxID=2862362 RepID=A0AAW0ECF9_9AGAR
MSAQAIPSTVQNIVVLDLTTSYGALIIAAYISCALWGINVMQSYLYYWNYPDDSWAVKTLVAFLLLVDTAHKILVTKVPWFTLVQNWGRVSAILASPQEALHEAWVGSIIIVIVQLYFLRRIAKYKVAATTRHARSWWLWLIFIILVGLAILQVPLTVAYCVFSINKANIFIPINLRIKRAGLVAAAVVDFVNAGAMMMLLKDSDSALDGRYRSKTTSRTIRRLTVITVNTGFITAVVAIISLVLDETASGTDFWTAIAQYPQCSIYFSAFLANLNARHYIRGVDGNGMTISNIEDLRFATSTTATAARGDTEAGIPTNATDQQHIVLGHLASSGLNSSDRETTQHSDPEKFSH